MSKKKSKPTASKADWPLHECWISRDWQEPMNLVQILVARLSSGGQVACALFLVDLGCLGVKNARTDVRDSTLAYEVELRDSVMESQPLTPCSLDLAAKVVHEGIRYARSLGFSPHKDSRKALKLLHGAKPEEADEEVLLGDGTGKPFYVAGPYDNTKAVVHKLEQTVGDNYDYLIPVDEPLGF